MALPDKHHWLRDMKEDVWTLSRATRFLRGWTAQEAKGKKVLPSRWVYNWNFNLHGSLSDTRLWWSQETNIDNLVSFSPVIRFESVCCFQQVEHASMDVKTVTLMTTKDQEVPHRQFQDEVSWPCRKKTATIHSLMEDYITQMSKDLDITVKHKVKEDPPLMSQFTDKEISS